MIEVSTIITTYKNTGPELRASLVSILHQEKVNQEIILVMVSDDPNLDLIKAWIPVINKNAKLSQVILVKVAKERHPGRSPQGSFYQINEGLKHVTKSWIRWFSGDDILYPRSTFKQVTALQETGNLVSFGGYTIDYEERPDLGLESVKFFPYSRKIHQSTNFVGDVSLWSAELLEFTPFDWEKWGNYAFWDFWLRIYQAKGNVFHYTDEVLWRYIKRASSTHIKRRRSWDKTRDYSKQRKKLQRQHPHP